MNKLFTLYKTWFILLILSIITLAFLSSLPGAPTVKINLFSHIDKVFHFGYFMGISLLSNLYWSSYHPKNYLKLGWLSIIFIAILGLLDEWYQTNTPGRSGNDLGDLTADIIGGITGYLIISHLYRLTSKTT